MLQNTFIKALLLLCCYLYSLSLLAESNSSDHSVGADLEQQVLIEQKKAEQKKVEQKKAKQKKANTLTSGSVGEWEYELDPYYSNIAYFRTLDKSPVPELGKRSERQVYRDLFFSSYLPRFFLVEASINPMPILGVLIKSESAEDIYKNMKVTQDLNLVEVVTAGFEEPYALSLFLGNMVKYRSDDGAETESKGFMGYLASFGHLHIRKNKLVDDRWGEFEWKIKGDQNLSDRQLSWSFRMGFKIHDNPLITDEFYVAMKRQRVQEEGDVYSWIQNGGIEFKYRMDKNNGKTIGQQLIIDKKIPIKSLGWVVSLGVGVVRDTPNKYKGNLLIDKTSTSFVLRPSVTF